LGACALATGVLTWAEHPRLIPAPGELHYGEGYIDTESLCVAHSPSTDEDTFALNTLFQGLHVAQHACAASSIPVRLNRTGDLSPIPIPDETPGPDSREAYSVVIARDGIDIAGKSSAAIYYGVQTLLQMVENGEHGLCLPQASIKDWPALAYRGTLMDAGSEGPMLDFNEVKRQIDFIAKYKGNQYYFYSEGNIELRGYPLLNPNARFTQSQIREIVAYARQRHIDVVPAVELYAHLHDLLRIEQYSNLADFPHGTQLDPTNPQVKSLLEDWIAQLVDLFPSKFVDVGFDETWSLQKASAKEGTNSTPMRLFIDQLTTVTKLLQSHGKTVMAYADIMVKFPGIVPRLPSGLIALPWYYDPIHEAEYKRWLAPLVAEHIPHMVASGVRSWDQVAPDFTTSFENIDTFLVAGKVSHSFGLINTLWTDDGQALLQMSWPGIAYGAAAAWQHLPMQPATFFADYSRLQYSEPAAGNMSAMLTELNAAEIALQRALGDSTMMEIWRDPFGASSLRQTETHAEDLRQARLHAESALTQLYAIRQFAPDTPHLTSFIAGAQIIDLAGLKFISANEIDSAWKLLPANPTREKLMDVLAQGISNQTHSRCMDMMDGFTEAKETYRTAWLQQFNTYRLGTALGRWDAEYQFWLRAQTNFETLRKTFKSGDALPTLQQLTSGSF
jgi:hypothetical protein